MTKMKKTAAFLLALAVVSTMAIPVSAVQFVGGDMDGDDDADAADAALILQYAAYVGAGGTDSIYDYILSAENSDQGETENINATVVIENLSGKTFTEVLETGCLFTGWSSDSTSVTACVFSQEHMDDTIPSVLASLNGKTVQEMVSEYDINISGYRYDGDTYNFSCWVGSLKISFDLAHGAEAVENHADEVFFPLETAEEIQSDVLENITFSGVEFYIEFDAASNEKLLAAEELDATYIKSISDELMVTDVYYHTRPKEAVMELFDGGDMDGDSDVDAADAALILQYAAYVGAGGTDSIYDFISSAESSDQDETEDTTENTEGTVVIEELSGKTLADVISAGYNFNYFWEYPDYNYVVGSAVNDTYTDDTITSFVDSLTGKTVKEIRETYGISIGGLRIGDWIFYGYVGPVLIRFDLEHGAEAAANLPDGASLAEAEEIQSDVLENIEFGGVRFSIKFDEASNEKLLAAEELTVEYIESIADELVVTSVYYRVG